METKRTIAALAAGLVLGSAGVGGAATAGIIQMGYNVACEKSTQHAVVCAVKGDHANLGVIISTKMAGVVNAKTGAVLYVKAQR